MKISVYEARLKMFRESLVENDKGEKRPDGQKRLKEKYPALHGTVYHSEGTETYAKETAAILRREGVHATVWHLDGPKSGSKSVWAIGIPGNDKMLRR